jgi:hypothetical protein
MAVYRDQPLSWIESLPRIGSNSFVATGQNAENLIVIHDSAQISGELAETIETFAAIENLAQAFTQYAIKFDSLEPALCYVKP